MKSKNPFKVEFPVELKTVKSKVIYWFMWNIYLTDLGRGQIFGKITQLFTEISLLLLILDKLGIVGIDFYIIILASLIFAFIVWYSGWLYQHFGVDKIHNLLVTKRNPMMNDVYDNIKKGDKT